MKKTCIVMAFVSVFLCVVFYFKWAATENAFPYQMPGQATTSSDDEEVKQYYIPNDEDEFADDTILVMFKKDYNPLRFPLSSWNFPELEVERVKTLNVGKHQMATVYLKNKGRENVLAAIKLVEKRDEVYIAQPNFIYHLD